MDEERILRRAGEALLRNSTNSEKYNNNLTKNNEIQANKKNVSMNLKANGQPLNSTDIKIEKVFK